MTSQVGALNVYTCKGCGHRMVTVDRHAGVTPFMVLCRAEPSCGSPMYSSFYRVSQGQEPTHEWRRASAEELSSMPVHNKQHHDQGGLFLYRIGQSAQSTAIGGPNRHARRAAAAAARRERTPNP